MPQLTLYTNPQSRGRIARWMLEEVGEPYQAVVLDFPTTMKDPEYLALNPMGKVPTLTHGTAIVTECAAICTYLADAFPKAGLMPGDRGAFYRWMFYAAGPLEAAITDRVLGLTVPFDQMAFVGYGHFDLVIATLERVLSAQPYILGDSFSAADVYLGAQIGYGLRFKTLPPEPAFIAYWDRLKTRPALARANAADDALMPQK